MCFLRMPLKTLSGPDKDLDSSIISSLWRKSLEVVMRRLRLDIDLLHFLSAYLNLLNFLEILVAEQLECKYASQESFTTCMKPGCRVQKDSNLKILLLGIAVSIEIKKGTWSETGLAIDLALELGNLVVHSTEENTQSSCSSKGFSCILPKSIFAL